MDPGKRKSVNPTERKKMKTLIMPWEMVEIAKRR